MTYFGSPFVWLLDSCQHRWLPPSFLFVRQCSYSSAFRLHLLSVLLVSFLLSSQIGMLRCNILLPPFHIPHLSSSCSFKIYLFYPWYLCWVSSQFIQMPVNRSVCTHFSTQDAHTWIHHLPIYLIHQSCFFLPYFTLLNVIINSPSTQAEISWVIFNLPLPITLPLCIQSSKKKKRKY